MIGTDRLPAHELNRLTALVTGRPPPAAGTTLDPDQQTRLDRLVARRLAGEPLQYLEGTAAFGPIELAVDRRALIPRPETELLFEQAVAALGEAGPGTVIVDLCTGSGALALALKHRFPSARVYGTDLSASALELARENSARLGLEVTFLRGDLFEALPDELAERIDLLVANPPYVAAHEVADLPDDVRLHEPHQALVAGERGTEVLAGIAEEAPWWLAVGGWLFCEIGEKQGEVARRLFGAWLDTDLRPDLTGRDRILVARKGARCCV